MVWTLVRAVERCIASSRGAVMRVVVLPVVNEPCECMLLVRVCTCLNTL